MSTPLPAALSRRQILKLLSAAAAGGALGACSIRSDRSEVGARPVDPARPVGDRATETLPDPPRLVPGAVANRVLVLVELQGGNDGLSTVIPYTEGYLHDVRANLRAPDEEILTIDDRVGLAPQLQRLHQRGITIVEGVGIADHSLSHFAMERRWQQADPTGEAGRRFGYLGRLSDALDVGAVATGLSVAGVTPWLHSTQASTLSLPNPDGLWMIRDTDWDLQKLYIDAFDRFEGDPAISQSYEDLRSLANEIQGDDAERPAAEAAIVDDMAQQGGELARQLLTAADLISADIGLRVVHARLGGFDTHDDHQWSHPGLLTNIDAAIDGFLRLMEVRGLGDRVLVATVSEFGRRVRQNGQGLDHGAASTMMVAGPVAAQLLGEPSPVSRQSDLDEDGNLRMTTGMDAYLGSLAQEWLGVEAASIIPSKPELLGIA